MANSRLREEVEQLLLTHKFPSNLKSEEGKEPNLQSHIASLIRERILKFKPDLKMFTSVKGQAGTAPKMRLLGTDFWPDITLHSAINDKKLLAIELKLVIRESIASAVSKAIGQYVIYKTIYSEAIGFVLIYKKDRGARYHDYDDLFRKHTQMSGVHVIVRTP